MRNGVMIRLYAIFSLFCSLVCLGIKRECDKSCFDVRIYHLIDNANWGETDGSALQGRFQCLQRSSPRGSCSLHSSDSKSDWLSTLQSKYTQTERSASQAPSSCCPITVSMYHIHTWGGMSKWPHGPNKTALPSDLTLVESEESHARFGRLFHAAFPLYDGNSTTHPRSTIQRSYFRGWNSTTLLPLRPFNELIKAGVFIASTCHRGSETKRLQLVRQLQSYIRIDSLGKCMTTRSNPDDIVLKKGATEQETLRYKQESISKYMFYLAFENSFEPGYVTEKVFDALIAGTVPIYLGSTTDCKKLMPHPRAAIYVSDYPDIRSLASYMQSLMHNEAMYEQHRQWRRRRNDVEGEGGVGGNEMVTKSWPCRVCEWAIKTMYG